MALLDIVKKGSTSRSVTIRIIDATAGTPETGVVYNSAGIDLWYRREDALVVDITEAELTTPDLEDTWETGGFLHISDGEYRLDVPNAAFAAGKNYVDIGGTVTGMVVIGGRVKLVDVDLEDTVRAGLTALPDAAADAAGGLVISDAGGVDVDALMTSHVIINTTIHSDNRGTTSCRLTAGSDNNDAYNGMFVILDDDAGDGEYVSRRITDYTGATKLVTFTPAITENAEDGGKIFIVPSGIIDATTLGADCITAAKIATDAIDADALAADALAAINAEVLDVMATDTIAELAGDPGATPTHRQAIMLLYMALRNKLDVTATTKEIHNNAGALILQKALTDNDVTYSEGKMAAP